MVRRWDGLSASCRTESRTVSSSSRVGDPFVVRETPARAVGEDILADVLVAAGQGVPVLGLQSPGVPVGGVAVGGGPVGVDLGDNPAAQLHGRSADAHSPFVDQFRASAP